jgi:hypothetical protein
MTLAGEPVGVWRLGLGRVVTSVAMGTVMGVGALHALLYWPTGGKR